MTTNFRSWGTIPATAQSIHQPNWVSELPPLLSTEQPTLAVGNARSYGDSCLLENHFLTSMMGLNRVIEFDRESGLLTAEAGSRLCDLLQLIVPAGWFLPVTPGTSYITLGGAIANDVHGKNHHSDGTFGRHIKAFDLLTSDESQHHCTPSDHADLFNATIGGLGLTGVITAVTIQLVPITSSWLDVRYDAFDSLQEFASLSTTMCADYRYTVAWMDCATPGTVGRGVLMSANHADEGDLSVGTVSPKLQIPVTCPAYTLNRYSIRAFNALYYRLQTRKIGPIQHEHYQPYFYPLDAIGQWNRIYGRKGFHQYQFSVPRDALPMMSDILDTVIASGMGSFLAVLKEFGDVPSPGLLSFPREGYCLALDFSERGQKSVDLINRLDAMVREAKGAAYPAKDKLMSAEAFQQYFPQWESFKAYKDPACSSDFWQRVSQTQPTTTQP